MNTSTAELLQQMIDIKRETRTAISNKGVSVVGGMETYPTAIDEISQIFAGTEIDFTRAGWLKSDSDRQNQVESGYINEALQYSNLMWRLYGDYLNWDDYTYYDRRLAPDWSDKLVIAPMIVNYELDKPSYGAPFTHCHSLRYVPPFDTSRTTDFSEFFYSCQSLIYAPLLDTSKGTNFFNMFWYCTSLTSIPQYDTSNAEDVRQMFAGCSMVKSIPKLNFSKVKQANALLSRCDSLEYLGGFEGMKSDIDMHDSKVLTRESIINVIDNVYDWQSNPDNLNYRDWGDGYMVHYLTIYVRLKDILSDDDIARATNKGWTIRFDGI